MVKIVIVGGGPVGMTTALLLAREGHQVTVLDQDDGHPGSGAEEAWEQWRRSGVRQFRHPHILLPGAYHLLLRELSDAVDELKALGATPHNMLAGAFDLDAIGGRRPGDERFDTLAARRPVVEAAFALAAARTAGLTVRRGADVTGLLAEDGPIVGRPHVAGVVTRDGAPLRADLVIDAAGRHSPIGKMLVAIGAAAPFHEQQDSSFLAYSRYFRSDDGSMPAQAVWPLEHHDSVSLTSVPGDAGTWSLAIFVSARDRAMRMLKEPRIWQKVAMQYPNMAHWANHGEPITGVLAMSGMEARRRRPLVEGRPVATGVLGVGDAWATTNPMFGLGIAMGMFHAVLLRDALREVGIDNPERLALRFDEVTNSALGPAYEATAAWDQHRLAQIDGEIAGVPYASDDPNWVLRNALEVAKLRDPNVLRAFGDVGSMLSTPEAALATPGLVDRVMALGGGADRYPAPGPGRAKLLDVMRTA